jgi:hypothetical protein
MPFTSDRPQRTQRLIDAAAARKKIKAALIEAFSPDEIGAMFDAMPDASEHQAAYRELLAAVGEAWGDHPDRKDNVS